MKVLITGAKGQLGFDCLRQFKSRGFNEVLGVDIQDFDITDKEAVQSFILKYRPDIIVHPAGWTAVDKAEVNRDRAYEINVLGTRYISEVASRIGAKLVYISTDYVFDGSGEDFYEVYDNKGPLSFYGQTKLEGEFEALKNKKTFIIRISWAFGINGDNFVKTMVKLSQKHDEISVVSDQFGSPTYTLDLAGLISEIVNTEEYGIYHATNEGVCSWYEFAIEIFSQLHIPVKVNPISTEDYLRIKINQAKRPLNSRLSKKSLDEHGFNRLPDWKDALTRYLKECNLL